MTDATDTLTILTSIRWLYHRAAEGVKCFVLAPHPVENPRDAMAGIKVIGMSMTDLRGKLKLHVVGPISVLRDDDRLAILWNSYRKKIGKGAEDWTRTRDEAEAGDPAYAFAHVENVRDAFEMLQGGNVMYIIEGKNLSHYVGVSPWCAAGTVEEEVEEESFESEADDLSGLFG